MRDATYGELLAEAERQLVRAIFATHEPFRTVPQARHAADDYAHLLLSLKGGIRTLAGAATPEEPGIAPQPESVEGKLYRALDDAVSSFTGSTEVRSWRGDWNAAARAISAATSLLASHLGPDRMHRTPDASLLDDPEARRDGLRRLAVFALTTAEGGRPLAFRLLDASIRFHQVGKLRPTADWLMEAQSTVGAAAAAVITTHGHPSRESNLSMLRPAPLLVPTRDSDPIAAARTSFDRVRLFAHRQARGELAAGIDAIRAYATVGMLVAVHGHAIVAAASEMRRGGADGTNLDAMSAGRSLLDMRRPWANLLSVTERCATTTHSPPLLGREATCLSSSLGTLTRSANRWRAPSEMVPNERVEQRLLQLVHHLGSRLPDIAVAARVVIELLHERGDLLGPTREREDLDVPYRWSPISSQRLGALRDASRDAQAATSAALTTDFLLTTSIALERQVLAAPTPASSKRGPTPKSTRM